MLDGFIKVAAATPKSRVADCVYNTARILETIDQAEKMGAKIMVFPELSITGYTCGDLFWQEELIVSARHELHKILFHSRGKEALIFVGLPWEKNGKLYNVAAAIWDGRLLGLTPKKFLPNYGEFYEARNFVPGNEKIEWVEFEGTPVPFGIKLLYTCPEVKGLTVGAEICEDLWAPNPPSICHALNGASMIVNLSASNETAGKSEYRKALVKGQSARLLCGYVYASAGEGESTTDLVFGGHNLIAENGVLLKEAPLFQNGLLVTELDVQQLLSDRRKQTTFFADRDEEYQVIPFHLDVEETTLTRTVDPSPFLPKGKEEMEKRCQEIFLMQAMGLKKRLEHTNCQSAVLGISGGLDSTLALLVTVKAFDLLKIKREQITCVTMPCFGTTDRTYQNACLLTKKLGASLKEVNIKAAVRQHFLDIGQEEHCHDVTYENSQARERTQVLMDMANQTNGMVIGTGDMSELALGWATYNGDHMSMYGVNASVPKTLVRCLVESYAESCQEEALKPILLDILDTPVSPELLPPKEGEIAQKTEDLVGPYELHDFFLYYVLRFGFRPGKIYRLSCLAFAGKYEKEEILKWLKTFYRRFFSQQFKRSCLPDGPKVGTVSLSPRGDLRMPSDACVRIWLDELSSF